MRIIPRRWDGINFIRLGARVFTQLSEYDRKSSSVRELDTHLTGYYKPGEPGSGAGRGGGGGGTIRKAGGSFGKRGASLENEFFYKQQQQLLQRLREMLKERRCKRECQRRNQRKMDDSKKEKPKDPECK